MKDPRSSLEFPLTLCGGGMDIFWKHTIPLALWNVS